MSFKKNMSSCSPVFQKKHVLLFFCLFKKTCPHVLLSFKKNMFSCSHVFQKKHVLLFFCLFKKNMFSCLNLSQFQN